MYLSLLIFKLVFFPSIDLSINYIYGEREWQLMTISTLFPSMSSFFLPNYVYCFISFTCYILTNATFLGNVKMNDSQTFWSYIWMLTGVCMDLTHAILSKLMFLDSCFFFPFIYFNNLQSWLLLKLKKKVARKSKWR